MWQWVYSSMSGIWLNHPKKTNWKKLTSTESLRDCLHPFFIYEDINLFVDKNIYLRYCVNTSCFLVCCFWPETWQSATRSSKARRQGAYLAGAGNGRFRETGSAISFNSQLTRETLGWGQKECPPSSLQAKPVKNNHKVLDLDGDPTGTCQTRESFVAVVLGPTSIQRRKKWQQRPNVRGVRGQRSDLNSHQFIVSEMAIF